MDVSRYQETTIHAEEETPITFLVDQDAYAQAGLIDQSICLFIGTLYVTRNAQQHCMVLYHTNTDAHYICVLLNISRYIVGMLYM